MKLSILLVVAAFIFIEVIPTDAIGKAKKVSAAPRTPLVVLGKLMNNFSFQQTSEVLFQKIWYFHKQNILFNISTHEVLENGQLESMIMTTFKTQLSGVEILNLFKEISSKRYSINIKWYLGYAFDIKFSKLYSELYIKPPQAYAKRKSHIKIELDPIVKRIISNFDSLTNDQNRKFINQVGGINLLLHTSLPTSTFHTPILLKLEKSTDMDYLINQIMEALNKTSIISKDTENIKVFMEIITKLLSILPSKDAKTKQLVELLCKCLRNQDLAFLKSLNEVIKSRDILKFSSFVVTEIMNSDVLTEAIFKSDNSKIPYFKWYSKYIVKMSFDWLINTNQISQVYTNENVSNALKYDVNRGIDKVIRDFDALSNGELTKMIQRYGGLSNLNLTSSKPRDYATAFVQVMEYPDLLLKFIFTVIQKFLPKEFKFLTDISKTNWTDPSSILQSIEKYIDGFLYLPAKMTTPAVKTMMYQIKFLWTRHKELFRYLILRDVEKITKYLVNEMFNQIKFFVSQLDYVTATKSIWYVNYAENMTYDWLINQQHMQQVYTHMNVSNSLVEDLNNGIKRVIQDFDELTKGKIIKTLKLFGGIDLLLLTGTFGRNLTIPLISIAQNTTYIAIYREQVLNSTPPELHFLAEFALTNWTDPSSISQSIEKYINGFLNLPANMTTPAVKMMMYQIKLQWVINKDHFKYLISGDMNRITRYFVKKLFNLIYDYNSQFDYESATHLNQSTKYAEKITYDWLMNPERMQKLCTDRTVFNSYVEDINEGIKITIQNVDELTEGDLMKSLQRVGGMDSFLLTGTFCDNLTIPIISIVQSPKFLTTLRLMQFMRTTPPELQFLAEFAHTNWNDSTSIFKSIEKYINGFLNLPDNMTTPALKMTMIQLKDQWTINKDLFKYLLANLDDYMS